jgi:hypothetical protein
LHSFLPFNGSDDSDDESTFEVQPYLMDEVGIVEGAFCELTHEHHLEVKVCSYVDLNADCYIFHLLWP